MESIFYPEKAGLALASFAIRDQRLISKFKPRGLARIIAFLLVAYTSRLGVCHEYRRSRVRVLNKVFLDYI